jgi:translation initiation factor 4E
MKRVLAFPPDTKVEWKSHDDSIQQRTAIDDARKDKSNQHGHHPHAPSRTNSKDDYLSHPRKESS